MVRPGFGLWLSLALAVGLSLWVWALSLPVLLIVPFAVPIGIGGAEIDHWLEARSRR